MPDLQSKKLAEAYILGIPFGLFGAHHFYLKRKFFGILYVCTLGLFGIGYIYDLCRMKWLVRHANRYGTEKKMVSDVYLICALGGIFGAHHFYLGNKKLGIFYACTLGVFLVGWIVDLIRMKWLVKDCNSGQGGKSLGTAYILGFSPFGIFGAYHYYLGNWRLGLIYTFTLGIFGIGWIVDLCRMKKLVSAAKNGINKRSVKTAYIMAVPPFGLFGAYHYYLGNYALGIVHTCTLGIFGIGWVVDLFRMKGLVAAANDSTHDHGMTKITAYVLCISPLGLFGAHHFYLERYFNGGFYIGTLGFFGFGWIFDMFRLPVLYERYATEDEHKYPDEAYMFWFPFGIFGLHHFYLGNKKWGIIYLCTLGCLLVGWLIDSVRLVFLLKEYNDGVRDPDMNNFRICRPKFKKCSLYNCQRCCLSCFTACSCWESFSLSRQPKSDEADSDVNVDNDVNRNPKVKDDFDVIQEMYPNENLQVPAVGVARDGNWSKASMLNNYDASEINVSTVEGEGYSQYPSYSEYPNYSESENVQGYDYSAYPSDSNIVGDEQQCQATFSQEDYDNDENVRHHEDVQVDVNAEEVAQNYSNEHAQEHAQYTQSQDEMYNESWTDGYTDDVEQTLNTIDNAIEASQENIHI